MDSFDETTLPRFCDHLAKQDKDLRNILSVHGYPPYWSRKPNFETLVHIILEQQVSIASARSTLLKLKTKLRSIVPERIDTLSEAEIRECSVTRQKAHYIKLLAQAILSKSVVLKSLPTKTDAEIRKTLIQLKGIGNWTIDVYLLMVLHRCDVFPIGDLAMINSLKKHKRLASDSSQEKILRIAEKWRPYRSIASILFWHAYILERGIKL